MEYRNMMIYYNLMVNFKEIDTSQRFLNMQSPKGKCFLTEYPIPAPPEDKDDEEAPDEVVTSTSV